ncbi:50S ribosomal protein L15 [Candidatus Falkowbacteria bacterium]|nr:50S ribosomal protein L15 [Candidatus Falkowbacteria bacterium]
MLSLNTIKLVKGSIHKKKRIGRGNASGHGTYSGRGMKGQRSRSGVTGLKRLGMKKILLSIPKKRGFKSRQAKNQVVNLLDINKNFKENEIVNAQTLIKKALINNISLPIKVLGKGELKVKNLQFQGIKTSKSAAEQIKKAGGKYV